MGFIKWTAVNVVFVCRYIPSVCFQKALVERDPNLQERIDQLMREYSTSEDALRVIREYYAYAQTNRA